MNPVESQIHPTAVIDSNAHLGNGVTVGPYAVIGPNVRIGAETSIGAHAVIDGNTTIGQRCKIFPSVAIGTVAQDLKYKGENSFLRIGDDNTIREFSTINLGTEEGSTTVIGNNNMLMAYSHVAHNCRIGNRCVLVNCGTLAGHVTLEDGVILGGLSAIHQFTRVGAGTIIGGCSKIVQDVVPYSMCDGNPARIRGINLVGLKRSGVPAKTREELKKAFKILFSEGHSFSNAATLLQKQSFASKEAKALIDFVETPSKRGLTSGT